MVSIKRVVGGALGILAVASLQGCSDDVTSIGKKERHIQKVLQDAVHGFLQKNAGGKAGSPAYKKVVTQVDKPKAVSPVVHKTKNKGPMSADKEIQTTTNWLVKKVGTLTGLSERNAKILIAVVFVCIVPVGFVALVKWARSEQTFALATDVNLKQAASKPDSSGFQKNSSGWMTMFDPLLGIMKRYKKPIAIGIALMCMWVAGWKQPLEQQLPPLLEQSATAETAIADAATTDAATASTATATAGTATARQATAEAATAPLVLEKAPLDLPPPEPLPLKQPSLTQPPLQQLPQQLEPLPLPSLTQPPLQQLPQQLEPLPLEKPSLEPLPLEPRQPKSHAITNNVQEKLAQPKSPQSQPKSPQSGPLKSQQPHSPPSMPQQPHLNQPHSPRSLPQQPHSKQPHSPRSNSQLPHLPHMPQSSNLPRSQQPQSQQSESPQSQLQLSPQSPKSELQLSPEWPQSPEWPKSHQSTTSPVRQSRQTPVLRLQRISPPSEDPNSQYPVPVHLEIEEMPEDVKSGFQHGQKPKNIQTTSSQHSKFIKFRPKGGISPIAYEPNLPGLQRYRKAQTTSSKLSNGINFGQFDTTSPFATSSQMSPLNYAPDRKAGVQYARQGQAPLHFTFAQPSVQDKQIVEGDKHGIDDCEEWLAQARQTLDPESKMGDSDKMKNAMNMLGHVFDLGTEYRDVCLENFKKAFDNDDAKDVIDEEAGSDEDGSHQDRLHEGGSDGVWQLSTLNYMDNDQDIYDAKQGGQMRAKMLQVDAPRHNSDDAVPDQDSHDDELYFVRNYQQNVRPGPHNGEANETGRDNNLGHYNPPTSLDDFSQQQSEESVADEDEQKRGPNYQDYILKYVENLPQEHQDQVHARISKANADHSSQQSNEDTY